MTTLKPLLVATQDTGGAGFAALRLLDALKIQAIDAQLLTYYKKSRRQDVGSARETTSGLEKWWLRGAMRYTKRRSESHRIAHNSMWSSNLTPNPFHRLLNRSTANVLHLHWIGSGFLPLAAFAKLNKPLVWTLHDMWAFTGGCHYTHGCDYYETHCGSCPQLDMRGEHDLSYRIFEQKLQHWRNVPMTIITPSHWLAECARQSSILRDKIINVIPNPIDTAQFQPLNQTFARQVLHLPTDKQLILFGAGHLADRNKGLDLLIAALSQFKDNQRVELVLFGGGNLPETNLPIPYHTLGMLNDTRLLALLYNAADVIVIPSRQENLSNTVLEALACGTPCVAFKIGGMPDMIDHQENGYLAEAYSVDDLARGIRWVLSEADATALADHARQKVLAQFSMEVVARQYIAVYERVLGNSLS
jgi:glycosyltransferase involved in cell wall biosynthesis